MGHDLYSIGDFSRMSRLTVKALRIYDEQGILGPAYTDPRSGYRYYSSAQLGEARSVHLLRSLEMPLAEVREYLRESDPGGRSALLERHRAEAQSRFEEWGSIIDSLQRVIEGKESVMERNIELKEVPEQNIVGLRLRTSMAAIGDDIGKGYGSLFAHVGQAGAQPVGPPFALYHGTEFTPDDIDMEVCVPVAGAVAGGDAIKGYVLTGGLVASTMHAGPYDSIDETYRDLMLWISDNGFRPLEPCREVYLTDPGQVKDPADNRTEVMCPVEKVE